MTPSPALRALAEDPAARWRPIEVAAEVDSTNLWARRAAPITPGPRAAFIALSQSAGRGRLGRPWHAPAGLSLCLSALVELGGMPLAQAPTLTFGLALATRDALRARGLRADLKWPNDVVVEGAGGIRKIGGILAEMVSGPGAGDPPRVILGVGVNLGQGPGDWPPELRPLATSLRMETGQGADPQVFGAELLRCLSPWLDRAGDLGGAALVDAFRQGCITIGRRVAYSATQGEVAGRADGMDEGGALIVLAEDGARHRITAGDVRLLPL